ncbi:hypothetical protein FACS189490_13310 [Clostridia bacterium]|nr:hypothetical protein FACS189490_13310 [Clostridia bacterium]
MSGDVCVDEECAKTLPKDALSVLTARFPDVFKTLRRESLDAGFEREETIITGKWSNAKDESNLADLCRELGVSLFFTKDVRYCYK